MRVRRGRTSRATVTAAGVSGLLTLLALGPALRPGFVLTYDMVFVPDQPLVARSVGLGAQLPRAVPVDAVVAVADTVLGGQVLQKLALVGALVAAGTGAGLLAGRLAARCDVGVTAASGVAAALAVWNPWVAQRLLIGHWSLLVGYAVLPWLLLVGLAARARASRTGTATLVLLMAVAALTPTGGVMAAAAALCVAARRRQAALLAAAAVGVNAPWWVPAVLNPAVAAGDPAGVAAFALRGETAAGPLVSALGLGGIWNAQVVTPGRASVAAQVASAVVLALALAGGRRLLRAGDARSVHRLGAVAGVGLGLAVLGTLPVVGEPVLAAVVQHVPGGGLLRDAHKWLALAAPPLAVCAGLGTARVAAVLGDTQTRPGPRSAMAVACGLLAGSAGVLTVPDLASGVGGRLQPVRYPDDWRRVAAVLDDVPRADVLVVLPFQPFRAFEWNGGRTVLDPAPRWFAQDVVVDDRLTVGDVTLAGESAPADRARAALRTADPARALADAGVTWVLVERRTPGALPRGWPGTARPVVQGRDLALYRLPGPGPARQASPSPVPVLLAYVAAAAAVSAAGVVALRGRARPR